MNPRCLVVFPALLAVACGGGGTRQEWEDGRFPSESVEVCATAPLDPERPDRERCDPPVKLPTSPDLGGGLVDCAALDDYEVQLLEDFEWGVAQDWYISTDQTAAQIPPHNAKPVWGEPLSRCESEWALHIQGGPFTGWGGSFGKGLRPQPDGRAWEGVVIWARAVAASSSEGSLRVAVSDKWTDDKAREEREDVASGEVDEDRVCTPDILESDPANGCDKFGYQFAVNDTFRAYLVPFAEMRQGGLGMYRPELDLSEIWAVTVSYEKGLWDIWLDDIGFYRRKQ
jgi:hypothetical protein